MEVPSLISESSTDIIPANSLSGYGEQSGGLLKVIWRLHLHGGSEWHPLISRAT